jgi:hypothetical protein
MNSKQIWHTRHKYSLPLVKQCQFFRIPSVLLKNYICFSKFVREKKLAQRVLPSVQGCSHSLMASSSAKTNWVSSSANIGSHSSMPSSGRPVSRVAHTGSCQGRHAQGATTGGVHRTATTGALELTRSASMAARLREKEAWVARDRKGGSKEAPVGKKRLQMARRRRWDKT